MKKYHGKIQFKIGLDHPDFMYIEEWEEDKVFTFEDTYTFDENHAEESIYYHMKNDMALVAGGGYNTDHIEIVSFEIKKCS